MKLTLSSFSSSGLGDRLGGGGFDGLGVLGLLFLLLLSLLLLAEEGAEDAGPLARLRAALGLVLGLSGLLGLLNRSSLFLLGLLLSLNGLLGGLSNNRLGCKIIRIDPYLATRSNITYSASRAQPCSPRWQRWSPFQPWPQRPWLPEQQTSCHAQQR
ncbi:uncharacterized protein P174DRAFT_202902 [Aspergillus novofumigatus IBT 16806]|uniref:Uncharacterized protein n=1 Tax=Aspergillus novofumigatus (strain IBT 16806) TaxID=1392255 RepID=A0A2I1C4I7_ASPN1|nr:uncharacterized protein P174DRAFT_202902 [Aspergillus novofumigatus IBT 16806]PKX92542.1 hypothetical protein P174DRAFT_202902 [Aspergillus novofumigatus IBT 16806]